LYTVCTEKLPVVAPTGTTNIIWVVEDEVTVAGRPSINTFLSEDVALKFLPVIVTGAPTTPLAGLKLISSGSFLSTVKFVDDSTV